VKPAGPIVPDTLSYIQCLIRTREMGVDSELALSSSRGDIGVAATST